MLSSADLVRRGVRLDAAVWGEGQRSQACAGWPGLCCGVAGIGAGRS